MIDGYWKATEVEMTDLRKNHSTVFLSTEISFDNGLTEDDFTIREMKK
jgi:hypothetical protein